MNHQMKSVEEIVKSLSERYGFDYSEAVTHISEVSKLLKEEEEKKKLKFKLPFCNQEITGFCSAIRPNGGLYTQCMTVPIGSDKYCKTCLKNAVEGVPQHGDISDRINNPKWETEKGKKPLRYSKIMKNIKIDDEVVSQVEVEKEAARFGLTIPETEFEVEKSRKGRPPKATSPKKDEPAKKRGRPKKEKPIANNTNEESGEDLIAKLVAEAKLKNDEESSEEEPQEETPEETQEETQEETPMIVPPNSITSTSGSETEKDEKKKKKHKPRKTQEEKKAEDKEKKDEEKAAAKAKKDEEKAAAKAKKDEEKAAAKEAAKAAKLAETEAAKAEKNSPEPNVDELAQEKYVVSPASEHKGSDNESEDEDETEVESFEYNGKRYLRDGEGTVYDSETHDAVGTWDGDNVEFYKE